MTAPLYPRRWSATRRDPLGLTRRQREVAGLLCTPLDGPAVARQLGCAYETLRRHTKALYRALNVHSRAELIAKLRAAGPALDRKSRNAAGLAKLREIADEIGPLPCSMLAVGSDLDEPFARDSAGEVSE